MTRRLAGLMMALLMLPVTGHATVGIEFSDIEWQPYSPATSAKAKQQGRPQFVFIYAQWCQFCERFEKQTLESAPIRARLEKEFVPIALDYDQSREQVKQLGVKMVPTTIILAPDGRQLLRFLGVVSVTELLGIMDKAQQLLQAGGSDAKEFGSERTCCPLDEAPGAKKQQ
jgi:thiol:disulfide interchange protein